METIHLLSKQLHNLEIAILNKVVHWDYLTLKTLQLLLSNEKADLSRGKA